MKSKWTLALLIIFFCAHLDAAEISHSYIDTPSFNLLPNASIADAKSIFGETDVFKTPLAHNYALYYDYKKNIGMVLWIYQSVPGQIGSITILKDEDYKNLHYFASLGTNTFQPDKTPKPRSIKLKDALTAKGLKMGMSTEDVEAVLQTKLSLKDNEARIGWEKIEGGKIIDYGGIELKFNNEGLFSISWSGVDP